MITTYFCTIFTIIYVIQWWRWWHTRFALLTCCKKKAEENKEVVGAKISRLQRVPNTAARIIARIPRCAHITVITPVLKQLHWLPVEKRVQYKVLLHTYKALNGTSPSYITNLIEQYQPARSLRSQSRSQLRIPATRSETFGDRSFVKAAPQLWNGPPKEITNSGSILTFRRLLKTHLFRQACISP